MKVRKRKRGLDNFLIFLNLEMRLSYNLLILVTDGIRPLLSSLEKHIIKIGREDILRLGSSIIKEPKAYVDSLSVLYKKYSGIVSDCFRQDASFEASLDKVKANIFRFGHV